MSVPVAGLLLAGEVELIVVLVDEVIVLGVVVLDEAAVVVGFTAAGLGVGAFRAAATVDVAVVVFVEALDVAVDVNVDRVDVVEVTGRVVLGAVVLGDKGVLLLGPLAGDAVRVGVLLAATLDVAVFFPSSAFAFVTGGLETPGRVVEDKGFVPKAPEPAAVVFGLAAGTLAVSGCLVVAIGAVLVVAGRAATFAGDVDFAVMLVLAGEALEDVEEPDIGLLVSALVDPEA